MDRFERQPVVSKFQERFRQLWTYKSFRMYITWAMVLTVAFLVILVSKALFFLAIFLVLNIVLGFILNPFKMFLFGIELTMLATVTTTIVFGAKVGIVIGVLTLIAKFIFQTSFAPHNLGVIISYVFVGIIAGSMTSSLMTIAWACILFHVIFTTVITFFLGANPVQIIIFWVTHIPFNLFLFSTLGPWLLRVMG